MTPEAQMQIRALQGQVEVLEEKVDKLADSVDELVKLWSAAKGMTTFIKWVASLASAYGVIYALLHGTPK